MGSMAESKVAGIVKSLESLEDDLDAIHAKSADIKRRLAASAQAEIEKMREKTRQMAMQEAESIIGAAKEKAGAEASRISQEGEARLAGIRSRIDSGFDGAVEHVVSTVLKA